MLSMLCLVVVFGAHSLIDWTWYVPGDACVALLCAGWLAGRGPLIAAPSGQSRLSSPSTDGEQPHGSEAHRRAWSPGRPGYVRLCVAGATIVAALLAAWSQWQPQRSEEARQEALALLERDPRGATVAANRAVSRDPLSVEALFTLASVEQVSGRPALARATLERAVRLQPSNPQTWLELGRYDLSSNPRAAVKELQAAIYLNPESIAPEAIAAGQREAIEIHNDYIQALTAATQPAAPLRSVTGSRSRAGAAGRLAGRRRSGPRSARSRSPRSVG